MSRWIDAEWLLNFFEPYPNDYQTPLGLLRACVDDAPTIDAPKWIPCAERLPSEDGWYLIALLTEHGTLYLPAHWYRGRWLNVNEHEYAVWMPIPPYTGKKETDHE